MKKLVCPICKVGLLKGKHFLGINIICECCECFKEVIMNAGYFVLAIKEESYGKKKETN